MRKVLGVIITVLFIAAASTVFAVGPGGLGPKGYRHGYGPGVDLSKEQMDRMWQIRERFNTETSTLRYELFQKRNELRTLYSDPKASDAAILAKEKEVDTLGQKMRDRTVRFKLEQRKVYTPEQLQKLTASGYGPGFGGGRGPGPCARF